MISVLAPTVFAEGLSQEKAFHSCLMLKLFFTKSWLHRAWYRTSQLVLLGRTTGIPLRYEHVLFKILPQSTEALKGCKVMLSSKIGFEPPAYWKVCNLLPAP